MKTRLDDTTFVFPSIANQNLRYRIYEDSDSNPAYDWRRSSTGINWRVSAFDTMGDGEVQHSPDYMPPKEETVDFISSLFAALSQIQPGTLPKCLENLFHSNNDPSLEFLEFCWNVKEAPEDSFKYAYVNLRDLKRSMSESKSHDKRWLKLENYLCANSKGLYQDKISALWCLCNSNENPNKPLNWFDYLVYLVAFEDKLDIGRRSVAEFAKQWDVLKHNSVEELDEMMTKFSMMRKWSEAQRTALWYRDRFQDAAEKAEQLTEEAVA